MPSFLLPCITDGAVGGTDRHRLGSWQKEVSLRIDSSVIGMQSSRRYASVTAKSVTGSMMRRTGSLNSSLGGLFGSLVNTGENAEQTGGNEGNTANLDDITTHFKNLSNTGRVSGTARQQDPVMTIRQQCVRFLMDLFFRYRGERVREEDLTGNAGTSSQMPVYQVNTLTSEYYHREEEHTTFATQGMVRTADGRELSFNLEFSMSRSFEEYYRETYTTESVKYCDPLVINLDTNVAQVSDQKFFFDLDQDGKEEEISNLKAGSGFLALDLNGDGKINDGGELFGTKSGDGFADLENYDSDGNGWIDEADPIWEKLLIWTKDENGNDKLYHLSDLGVGAIGLSRVSTQFALNSEKDNHSNAMIRKTGIFLYENGNVSTVQHLDLVQ